MKKAPDLQLNARQAYSIGIVCANFNPHITGKMLDAAQQIGKHESLVIKASVKVPGSFEIPLATQRLLQRADIQGVVCLGAILKGSTDHDQAIGHSVAQALLQLELSYQKPVGFGIIGPNATEQQAIERAEEYARRAILAVKEMLILGLGFPKNK